MTCLRTNDSTYMNDLVGYQAISRYDPTRTLTLRRRFVGQMRRRFRRLKGEVRRALVEQRVLGNVRQDQAIDVPQPPPLPGRQEFEDEPDNRKVEDFMDWMNRVENQVILEQSSYPSIVGGEQQLPWTSFYIYLAYVKGIERARLEMRRAGYETPSYIQGEDGEREEDYHQAAQTERHKRGINLLYTQAYMELTGIVEAVNQEVSRQITRGLLEDESSTAIADRVTDRIDRTGLHRGRILSRTETVRAHTNAMLEEMSQWGIDRVTAQVEFTTAKDERVCTVCRSLEGTVYSIDEARGIIPVHPQCRCVWLPVAKTEEVENATT